MLVLVSPCFRENVNVTCKIVLFLFCFVFFFNYFFHFLLKNAVVFIFGNQLIKWGSFEKRLFFYLYFTLFSRQGNDTFPQHISHLGAASKPNRRSTAGSGRFSLFGTIETARNRTEPLVNRQLGFEVVPYIRTYILLTLLTFLPSQFCKNCEFIMYGFSLV